jgi:hypothetical protein
MPWGLASDKSRVSTSAIQKDEIRKYLGGIRDWKERVEFWTWMVRIPSVGASVYRWCERDKESKTVISGYGWQKGNQESRITVANHPLDNSFTT